MPVRMRGRGAAPFAIASRKGTADVTFCTVVEACHQRHPRIRRDSIRILRSCRPRSFAFFPSAPKLQVRCTCASIQQVNTRQDAQVVVDWTGLRPVIGSSATIFEPRSRCVVADYAAFAVEYRAGGNFTMSLAFAVGGQESVKSSLRETLRQ